MVRAVKGRLGGNYPVSIKIRVDDDPQQTKMLIDNGELWPS
jgi:tRNA-dihydrouridine synthase